MPAPAGPALAVRKLPHRGFRDPGNLGPPGDVTGYQGSRVDSKGQDKARDRSRAFKEESILSGCRGLLLLAFVRVVAGASTNLEVLVAHSASFHLYSSESARGL